MITIGGRISRAKPRVASGDNTRPHAEVHAKIPGRSEDVLHSLRSALGEDDLLDLVVGPGLLLGRGEVLLGQVDASVPGRVLPHLLNSAGPVWRGELAVLPVVVSHFANVLQKKLDPCRHVGIRDESLDSVKVLIHQHFRFSRIQKTSACFHEMSQTLDILGLVDDRLLPPAHQQLLAASV